MIIINRKKFLYSINEIYFSKSNFNYINCGKKSDIDISIQSNCFTPNSNQYLTSIINLDHEIQVLFSKISKRFKYEISRAGNKDFATSKFIISPSLKDIDIFCGLYNKFSKKKIGTSK